MSDNRYYIIYIDSGTLFLPSLRYKTFPDPRMGVNFDGYRGGS